MAKPKRPSQKHFPGRTRNSRDSSTTGTSRHSTVIWAEAIVWGLFLARWLIPTEGTAKGDTLWLTSLTLAAAAVFFCWHSRVSFDRFRFEKLDIAVWLLCGAHVLSSLVVILTEGNKRTATNMLWEWLAVAVTFSMLRQTITVQSRSRFLQTVLVVTTALACYGIWQPTFWYPSNLSEYQNIQSEIDAIKSSSDMSRAEQGRRQQELRAKLVSLGIPLSGQASELFERRLRDSKEPLGFFALTNTFASFMTTSLILLAGTLVSRLLSARLESKPDSERTADRGIIYTLAVALILVTYCLVLTKSRSAWGGTAIGLCTLIGLLGVSSKSGAAFRKLIPIILVSVAVIVLLSGVAFATDALDLEVLTEASTSLKYRLEYWTSTWDVILDYPTFGTGPGNFRDSYLRHKLPQSSEEISDPHQFVLDVTANAGVVGFAGLLTFLAATTWLSWQTCKQTKHNSPGEETQRQSRATIKSTICVAAILVVSGDWLLTGSFSWNVPCVCLLAITIDWLVGFLLTQTSDTSISQSEFQVPPIAIIAALVALFVHLSAAGGIAMPAVIGLVFALTAVLRIGVVTVPVASVAEIHKTASEQNGLWLAAALLSGLTAVGCTMTAFGPVIQATSLQQLGDYEAINNQPARQVASRYRNAANADPLSPGPHIRLSQLFLHQWTQTHEENSFEQAIESAETAQMLSPNSPQIAHEIGYAWLVRARLNSTKDELTTSYAVQKMQSALDMYPTHPTWTAETAQAFALAGDTGKASALARQALELDRINQKAGHVDRYLPDDLQTDMKRLAGES